jgi:hypothetical protein
MANVFIFPIADPKAGTQAGVPAAEGFDMEAVQPFLREQSQTDYLAQIYPDGKCYPWGARESGENASFWNAMAKDDLMLGCRNGSIVSAAYVWMKIRNPELGARLWSGPAGEPFSLICFTDEPQWGDVPIVPQMTGYLDREYGGFTKLASEKRDNILRAYGSFETFVRLCLHFDFPFSFRHSE